MDRVKLAEHYAERFFAISRCHSTKKMNENTKGCGFLLMFLLKSPQERIFAGDIAKASGVSTARVAAALNKLEAEGLIVRRAADEDTRKTQVCLTEAGRKKAGEIEHSVLSMFADIIEAVGEVDIGEFLRIYEKINAAVENAHHKGVDNV